MPAELVFFLALLLLLALLWDTRSGGGFAFAGMGSGPARPLPWQPIERGEGTWVAKGTSAPKPDKKIGEAALKQAELGEDYLAITKEQFEISNARQAELDKLTKEIGNEQLAMSRLASQWAKEDRERYQTKFQPLQDQFIDTAKNWASDAELTKAAGEARATVLRSAAMSKDSGRREAAAYGLNPASGAFRETEMRRDLGTALGAAGASNIARDNRRKEGVALLADAINVGAGLPSQSAAGANLGLAGSSQVLAGANAAEASSRANFGIVGQGYNTAMGGYATQANILNQQYQNQLAAWQTQQQSQQAGIGGLFSAIGTGIGAYAALSSKEFKEGRAKIKGSALKALKEMPVDRWTYKRGIADGGSSPHVGPMAEDFRAATGLGDGKVIPLMDAIGVNMKATQELDEKVTKLAAYLAKAAAKQQPARTAA